MLAAIKNFSFLVFVLFLGACQASNHAQNSGFISASKLYYSSNCFGSNTRAYAKVLTNRNQLELTFSKITKNMLVSSQPQIPDVNLDQHLVLLLSMGQRSTGGYRLSLGEGEGEGKGEDNVNNTRVPLIDGIAHLTINWHEPSPGALTAQVITSPCILIKLPVGGYRSITVTDQIGKHRFPPLLAK